MTTDPLTTPEDHSSAQGIAEAVNEISERASLLIREEIELAKAEVAQKVGRLAKGAVVGGAAAVFAIFGVVLLFQGLAWFTWWAIPGLPDTAYFWGFFIVAAALFILGGLAGMVAARFFKSGSPPVPAMAIDEARKTKEELS